MNVNLTVAETDRSINMTVSDDLHEISLDASQDSYEFEMHVDGEIDFDVASYSGAYLFRQLPYSSNAKSLRKLVGCSFAWNQIARYLNRRSVRPCFGAPNAQVVSETNRSMTVAGVANTNYWNDLPSGHRILATAIITVDGTPVNNMQVNFGGNIVNTGVKLTNGVPTQIAVIGTQKGTGGGSSYNDFYFYPNGTGGAALNSFTITDFQLIDLTQMFGSTIADYIYNLGNVNGYSFFKNLFSKDYYPYDSGTLVSVKPTASKMMNADESSVSSYPLSGIELRGLPKLDANNNLYYDGDEFAPSGTVTRKYGIRQYQSGDESLADAITDGTNTVYKLQSATAESTSPYTARQICYPNGTEEFVDGRTVEVSVWNEAKYIVRQ